MTWLNSLRGVEADFDFMPRSKGMTGWMRKDLPKDLFTKFIADPDRFLDDPLSQTMKMGPKGKVVKRTLTDLRGGRWDVIFKRSNCNSFWRRMGCFVFASPAFQSLMGAMLLKDEQVHTAQPLAAFEYRRWNNLGTSYYLSEEVRDSQSIDAFWAYTHTPRTRRESLRERNQVLRAIASLFYQLHSSGIYHPDLKGANILLRKQGADHWQCLLVDVIGISKTRRISWTRRIKNLSQLERTFGRHLNDRERIYLVKRYADLFPLDRAHRKALAAKIIPMRKH